MTMLRGNIGGVLILFIFLLAVSYFGAMGEFFFSALYWIIGGIILLAADRLWNRGAALSFVFSLLWFGYWAYIAGKTFYIVGLFAFVSSLGASEGGKLSFLMFILVLFIFVGLAIINLMRLFIIPKSPYPNKS